MLHWGIAIRRMIEVRRSKDEASRARVWRDRVRRVACARVVSTTTWFQSKKTRPKSGVVPHLTITPNGHVALLVSQRSVRPSAGSAGGSPRPARTHAPTPPVLETRPVLLDCYKVLYVVAGQPQNRSANRPSLAEAVEGGCPALDLAPAGRILWRGGLEGGLALRGLGGWPGLIGFGLWGLGGWSGWIGFGLWGLGAAASHI